MTIAMHEPDTGLQTFELIRRLRTDTVVIFNRFFWNREESYLVVA